MKLAVWVVQPKGYEHSAAFREVAQTVNAGLKDAGHESSIVYGDEKPEAEKVIVFGPMLVGFMKGKHFDLSNCVAYNLEQMFEGAPTMREDLVDYIPRCPKIVDYNEGNAKFLKKKFGVDCDIVPICYHPILEKIPEKEKDIDVLFYGSMYERRGEVLNKLEQAGLNVKFLFGSYGKLRDNLIARSRCVINIHFYESKILEMVRLSYLMANKVFIVTEHGNDPEENKWIRNGVILSEYDDLVPITIEWLQATQEARDIVAERGYEIIKQNHIKDHVGKFLE